MIRRFCLIILFLLFPIENSFASKFISSLPDYHSWPVKDSYSIRSDEGVTERVDQYLERKDFFSSSVLEVYRKGEKKPRAIYWFDIKRNSRDEPVSSVFREYELINGNYKLVDEDYTQIRLE